MTEKSRFEFWRALLKHWGVLVTGGAFIGAIGIYQATGHYIPHWVYWTIAVVGLVEAAYRTWDEKSLEAQLLKEAALRAAQEKQREFEVLSKKLTDADRERRRELIEVLATLRALMTAVFHWRDITNGKWGLVPAAETLMPRDWSSVIFAASNVAPALREQVDELGATILEADRAMKEFFQVNPTFREQRLITTAYRLLNEAATRLSSVIAEFESYEKSLA